MNEIININTSYSEKSNTITRFIRYNDSSAWVMGISMYNNIIDINAHNFNIGNAPSNATFIIDNNDIMYIPFSNLIEKYNGYKEMLDPFYSENKKRIIFSKNENNDVVITFYNDNLNYDPDIEYGDYGYKFSIIYYDYQDTEDKDSLKKLFEELKQALKKDKVKKIEPR